MSSRLAKIFGVIIAGLAIIGLMTSGHFLGLMNVDMALDMLRVILAAYLLYVGFGSRTENSAKTALMILGILYLGMGVMALISPTIGGVLPSGLTGFDVAFHLLSGAFATYFAVRRDVHMPAHS